MKILFVLDKPNLYGSELHVKKLIEGLNGEFSIRLLTFQRGPLLDLMSVENIVFSLSWLDVFSLIKWKQLKISMLEEKVDLIHAHQPKAIFFMSLMGWFLNIKTIITIHSLPITNSQSHKNKVVSLAVYLGHQLIKLTSEFFANKVIYLSDFSFKTAFSKQKSMIIPNWINHNFAGIPNKVISSDSRIKFLTVGSISFNKGFDRLLNVLEKYENSNWELHVVGEIDPLFRDNFNRILNDIRFKDQIVFHGYLNNVKDLYESCDIFIL
jgi:glycosyltransferase involved in cell wall biosynthesis